MRKYIKKAIVNRTLGQLLSQLTTTNNTTVLHDNFYAMLYANFNLKARVERALNGQINLYMKSCITVEFSKRIYPLFRGDGPEHRSILTAFLPHPSINTCRVECSSGATHP